jgi:hypothetical protein
MGESEKKTPCISLIIKSAPINLFSMCKCPHKLVK